MSMLAAPLGLLALAGTAAAQDTCTVRPLKADSPPSAEALNESLACLQRRIERLEQQVAKGAAPGPRADSPSAAQAHEFDDVRVSLEHASIVDGKSLLLEWTIENLGEGTKLALIEAQGTVIGLRGDPTPIRFTVQGINRCPGHGAGAQAAIKYCIESMKDDNQWTALDPGRPLAFRIASHAANTEIKADVASVSLRLVVKDRKGPKVKDISFTRVPLKR
jgi:hypothetical protein